MLLVVPSVLSFDGFVLCCVIVGGSPLFGVECWLMVVCVFVVVCCLLCGVCCSRLSCHGCGLAFVVMFCCVLFVVCCLLVVV